MSLITENNTRGFTLIEVMVALVIFATVAIVAVQGLQAIMATKSAQSEHEEILNAWQVAYIVLKRDLYQVANRPIRNEQDQVISAFIGDSIANLTALDKNQAKRLVEFTRMGAVNPLYAEQKSTLLRVRYQLEGDTLYRITWPVLDRLPTTVFTKRKLLSQVEQVTVTYVDDLGAQNPSWLLLNLDTPVDISEGQHVQAFLPASINITIAANQHTGTWSYLLPGGRRLGTVQ